MVTLSGCKQHVGGPITAVAAYNSVSKYSEVFHSTSEERTFNIPMHMRTLSNFKKVPKR